MMRTARINNSRPSTTECLPAVTAHDASVETTHITQRLLQPAYSTNET